jgi:hypothetical protein
VAVAGRALVGRVARTSFASPALQKDRASSGAVCRPAIFRATGAESESLSGCPCCACGNSSYKSQVLLLYTYVLATVLCTAVGGVPARQCWAAGPGPGRLLCCISRKGSMEPEPEQLRPRHVISLGTDCFCRTQATRLGYMKARAEGMDSGPFDIAYHSYAAVCSLIRHDFAGYMGTRPRLQRRCRALLARSDLGLAEWTGAPPQSQGRCASTPWRARAPARVARSTLGCPALRSITRASPPATNSMRGPPRTLQSCGAAHPALLLTCLPPRTLSTVGAVDGRTQGSVHSASRYLPPENRGGD